MVGFPLHPGRLHQLLSHKVFDLRKLKAYCKKTNLNINSAIVSTNTTKDVRLYLNMIGFSFSIFKPGIIDEWNLEIYFDILG